MTQETARRLLHTVHLTNTFPPHNKFYDINIDRVEPYNKTPAVYLVWCRWGRIGTIGQRTALVEETFYTPAKTNLEVDKIIRKKQEKGYRVITDNRNDFLKSNAEEMILKFEQPEKKPEETKPLPFSSTSRFRGIL